MSSKRPIPKRLDEIIEGLPEVRRKKVEARTADLMKEAAQSYLPSMYGRDDDEDEDESPKPKEVPITEVTMEMADRGVVIMIDGKRVVLPSMAYVKSLEATNSRQAREINRLTNANKGLRDKVNGLVREVNSIWQALDRKIDRRDMI